MIVVKEAAAARLPVVASRHGGIPEIIEHGQTGFLAPERDVDALARHLRELAADRALRLGMGQAARAKIEREYDARRQNELLEQRLLRCVHAGAPEAAR
jgi:glycosyltransferase involved in cell wall biosynthesis